jgi:parallel beta-helix repeat protein
MKRRNIALALAAAGTLAAAPALAQLGCGQLVSGTTVTLGADVGPCDGVNGAIIVENGVLDLGGHTVSCADGDGDSTLPDGVVLLGKKSQVRNGTVTGCDYNVYVGGAGRHRVENVLSTGADDYGFYIASDSAKNRLTGNTARGNGDDGFQVRGAKNRIQGNVFEANGEDGIDLTQAIRNKIIGNTAVDNTDNGIEATGTKNKVAGNTSTGNGLYGIAVGDRGNKVTGNTATGNARADIVAQDPCGANKFKNNSFGSASSCVK